MLNYRREDNQLKQQLADIVYFMKGGVTWSEAWEMSFTDRELMIKTINKHLQEESGSKKSYM